MLYVVSYSLRVILVPVLLVASVITAAEPVQYCRFGHNIQSQDADVDFCLGVAMHQNASSKNYDMYLTMTVTRSSSLGWTAIGTGSSMAGSLMFILYGDPYANEPPTVSIRTVEGHHQPQLVSQADMGAADVRLLQASWVPASIAESELSTRGASPVSVAKLAIVCYSCEQWPGASISASAVSQPWIWAWNDEQEFAVYSHDAHLDAHKHDAGNGGWGRFYIDMARSINKEVYPPSLPQIRPHVRIIGASDSPRGTGWMGWLGPIHGLLLGTAYLILLPIGVVAMRCGLAKSFKYHWIIQLVGSVFIWSGVLLGILQSRRLDTTHQWIGITVAICSLVQILLGWRHHVVFMKTKRRQWASHSHIWLGRGFLIFGWGNIITGIVLAGHSLKWTAIASSVVTVDALVLIGCTWVLKRRMRGESPQAPHLSRLPPWKSQREEYFVLTAADEDEDDDRSSRDIQESPMLTRKDID
ncbi:hypothetical protein EYZ11_006694 [Aspergillus tanneri]|uniref:Cytochrome b561 domain-containing protein n=1 Tax=Aspergillus tanneri TaxID=1220188 RepID=A0A4S3JF61_9EURO|nr:uncharacterized protein ATNIH1004_009388 [Aspergillus tanneri]KAA8645171.1 hypothetical protein ATNIH1004_009388 [Aspergillus tanneri]THC93842.1 hypothetical protein EYZ11_006694 [Aspergillus tanneri]